MAPRAVSFGSDDYFALVAARPEWGRYLALGDHVIVVLEDTAYEVREGDAPPLEVPEAGSAEEPAGAADDASPDSPNEPNNVFEAIVQAILDLVDQIVEAFRK
jgi:hypothetical protein